MTEHKPTSEGWLWIMEILPSAQLVVHHGVGRDNIQCNSYYHVGNNVNNQKIPSQLSFMSPTYRVAV
jgi:hypothetical protein